MHMPASHTARLNISSNTLLTAARGTKLTALLPSTLTDNQVVLRMAKCIRLVIMVIAHTRVYYEASPSRYVTMTLLL